MKRGDVVIVPFPFQDRPGDKIRPALVVQADTENRRLANTVLAMITAIWLTPDSRRRWQLIQPLQMALDRAWPACRW
jgi:mRNA-degrading endonuclease toxin of MazEF toxin-antitoxin module